RLRCSITSNHIWLSARRRRDLTQGARGVKDTCQIRAFIPSCDEQLYMRIVLRSNGAKLRAMANTGSGRDVVVGRHVARLVIPSCSSAVRTLASVVGLSRQFPCCCPVPAPRRDAP